MYKEITYDDFFNLMKESRTVFDGYADRDVYTYDIPGAREVLVLIDEADQYDYFEEKESDQYTYRYDVVDDTVRVYVDGDVAHTFTLNITKHN